MLPGKLKDRFKAYLAVAIISILWFIFVGVAAFLVALLWQGVTDNQDLVWQIIIASVVVFLLPYLVIASKVWGVNLSILGTQAQDVRRAENVTETGQAMELPGQIIP
jgi:small basic protein